MNERDHTSHEFRVALKCLLQFNVVSGPRKIGYAEPIAVGHVLKGMLMWTNEIVCSVSQFFVLGGNPS